MPLGFNPYLADVYAAMSQVPPAPNMSAGGPMADAPPYQAPIVPPPPMPPAGAPEPPSMSPAPPPAPPPGPAPGASGNPFNLPLGSSATPVLPGEPAGPPMAPAGPPTAPAAPVNTNAFPLTQLSGSGTIPAHEVERRGPSLKAAQGQRNLVSEGTIANVEERNLQASDAEYGMHLNQERDARAREAAIVQSNAERGEELAQRQQDFDQSVKALSKMSMDPDRFWASRSTGQKIGAMVSIALGGFLQGAQGRATNPGMDIINSAIDRDLKAQEFAYHSTRDTAQAKQTAFGLAMQKYQNMDVARSMARAAALDSVQAQFGQNAAMWKSVEASNRADIAMAALQDEKMMQIAQGIAFMPSQVTGRRWVDENGITYDENQARARADITRANQEKRYEKSADVGGQLLVAGAKADAEAKTKGMEHAVRLPTGEVINAGSPAAMTDLKKAIETAGDVDDLVNQALEIRKKSTVGVPLAGEDNLKLQQINARLKTNFAVQMGLGALSKDDIRIAEAGMADAMSMAPGTNGQLENIKHLSQKGLERKVATIPGASAKSQGAMPPSFTKPGGK